MMMNLPSTTIRGTHIVPDQDKENQLFSPKYFDHRVTAFTV